jgi:hypothetical protein
MKVVDLLGFTAKYFEEIYLWMIFFGLLLYFCLSQIKILVFFLGKKGQDVHISNVYISWKKGQDVHISNVYISLTEPK